MQGSQARVGAWPPGQQPGYSCSGSEGSCQDLGVSDGAVLDPSLSPGFNCTFARPGQGAKGPPTHPQDLEVQLGEWTLAASGRQMVPPWSQEVDHLDRGDYRHLGGQHTLGVSRCCRAAQSRAVIQQRQLPGWVEPCSMETSRSPQNPYLLGQDGDHFLIGLSSLHGGL